MAEITGEPVGYVVVTWDATKGEPVLDDIYSGLHPEIAGAEAERGQLARETTPDRTEVHRVCAVVPVEDGKDD
jgi:hypothetical protein